MARGRLVRCNARGFPRAVTIFEAQGPNTGAGQLSASLLHRDSVSRSGRFWVCTCTSLPHQPESPTLNLVHEKGVHAPVSAGAGMHTYEVFRPMTCC